MSFFDMIRLLALRFEAFLTKSALIGSQLDVCGLYMSYYRVHVSKSQSANGANQFARLGISGCQFSQSFLSILSLQPGIKLCNRWVVVLLIYASHHRRYFEGGSLLKELF